DSLTPNNPVLVSRLDGHMALANSAALRMAGVTAASQNPDGGTIVRDSRSRQPTGMLRDNAMDLASNVIPNETESELDEAAARALAGRDTHQRHGCVVAPGDVSSRAGSRRPRAPHLFLRATRHLGTTE